MTGFSITIAQQKGGAGKTTVAAQLAAAFDAAGKTVATVDIDPQGSLTLWSAARMASLGPDNNILHSQITGWRLKREVARLKDECDVVIIDSPPHAESDAKMAIREADLLVIPTQPSPMDIWALKPTLDTAADEKIETMLLLNRVPPRTNLTEAITDKLAEMGIAVAKTRLGNRVAFAASLFEGKGVVETERTGRAADEINLLVKEILRRRKALARAA